MMDGTQAPQWVCDEGAMEGGLVAVGSAEKIHLVEVFKDKKQ